MFVVNWEPIAQPRHRVSRGRAYIPKDHAIHAFKNVVRVYAKRALSCNKLMPDGGLPSSLFDGSGYGGGVVVSLTFAMPRPQKLRKKPAEGTLACLKKPDIDNLIKAILDSLNGILWKDDSQVWHIQASKTYTSNYDDPHVIVQVGFNECADEV